MVATVLKDQIKKSELNKYRLAQQDYTSWLTNLFSGKQPNQKHKDIVATDYPYIITTNYDLLLESAARIERVSHLAKNSFTYEQGQQIMSFISHDKPCIVHAHGVAVSGDELPIDKIILTGDDYNRIIRQRHEGFSFVLRMLFTRYSTLFVGYGASDPHLEDIAEELRRYYPMEEEGYPLPRSFLIVTEERYDLVLDRWKDRLRTHIIVIKDFGGYEKLLKELRKRAPRQITDTNQEKLQF